MKQEWFKRDLGSATDEDLRNFLGKAIIYRFFCLKNQVSPPSVYFQVQLYLKSGTFFEIRFFQVPKVPENIIWYHPFLVYISNKS